VLIKLHFGESLDVSKRSGPENKKARSKTAGF
jgi:hypothetical protein